MGIVFQINKKRCIFFVEFNSQKKMERSHAFVDFFLGDPFL